MRAEPHVTLVTPRLAVSGIVSNGRASTIFVAEGLDPTAARELQAGLRFGPMSEMNVARDVAQGGVPVLDAAKRDLLGRLALTLRDQPEVLAVSRSYANLFRKM